MLRTWGIEPSTVVGHSSGESRAAFAAGIITMRDAIVTAYYCGYVLAHSSSLASTTEAEGSTCAVREGEQQCLNILHGLDERVQLAAVNSPCSCTLSGDRTVIQSIIELYTDKGNSAGN